MRNLILLFGLTAIPASAQVTIRVPADAPSLGLAIQQAQPADVIELDGGVHFFAGNAVIAGLVATAGTQPVIQDSHIVVRANDIGLTISGLKLVHSTIDASAANAPLGAFDIELERTVSNKSTVLNLLSDNLTAARISKPLINDKAALLSMRGSDTAVVTLRDSRLNNTQTSIRAHTMTVANVQWDAPFDAFPINFQIDGHGDFSNMTVNGLGSGIGHSLTFAGATLLASPLPPATSATVTGLTFCDNAGSVRLTQQLNITISRSLFCRNSGLVVENRTIGGDADFTENTFVDNLGVLFDHVDFAVTGSNFVNNAGTVVNSTRAFDFQGNYWGAGGPNHPGQNPSGTGQAINGFQNVVPWLASPAPNAPALTAVSVEEVPPAKRFSLYPSPARGQITVTEFVQVFDLLGRKVADGNGVLDVSRLAPGTYFARAESATTIFHIAR